MPTTPTHNKVNSFTLDAARRTHLHEVGAHVVVAVRHADTFAAASLRRLHHHRVADAVSGRQGFVEVRHLGLPERVLGNRALLRYCCGVAHETYDNNTGNDKI